MTNERLEVTLRPYNEESDLPFVYAAWKNAIWYDKNPNKDLKPDPGFLRIMSKKIKEILNHFPITVRIACLRFNPDQIIGYSVMEDKTIQFVYVKLDYRKQGIAKLLTKNFRDIIEPCTKIGMSIAKNHDLKIKENKEDESIKRSEGKEE